MGKYLDNTGLNTLWTKAKNTFASKADINLSNYYSKEEIDSTVTNLEDFAVREASESAQTVKTNLEKKFKDYLPKSAGEDNCLTGTLHIKDDESQTHIWLSPYDDHYGNAPCLNLQMYNSLTCYGNGFINIETDGEIYGMTLPHKSGTFALTSDLNNYVTTDGYSMRASSTALKFYYNTGNGEKAIQLKSPTIPTATSQLTNDSNFATTNDFKTINGQSIVGSGNITISGGGSSAWTQICYEDLSDGMTLTADVSSYNEVLVTFEDLAQTDQPSARFMVNNYIISISQHYANNTNPTFRIERVGATNDWLFTTSGFTSLNTIYSSLLTVKCSQASDSEEYRVRIYGK